jgi:hypothetical protein
MYLSNAEKEVLFLTGFGDVPPWAVQQGLEQALARGTYVPGEESLRLRLADALDLDERLAAQLIEEAEKVESNEFASNHQQGLLEGIEAFQEGEDATATEEATTERQEAPEEPPTAPWRSPLEIVTEGAEEPEQEPSGEEDAAPAATEQQIEDRDFSGFTKAQLVNFAWDQFGVELKRTDSKDELIAQVQQLVDEANG